MKFKDYINEAGTDDYWLNVLTMSERGAMLRQCGLSAPGKFVGKEFSSLPKDLQDNLQPLIKKHKDNRQKTLSNVSISRR